MCPLLGRYRWQAVPAAWPAASFGLSDGGSGNEPSGSGSGQLGTPCCLMHSAT